MARLTQPLKAVMNVLTLVASFIKLGISGVQKTFKNEGDSPFLPVTYISLKDLKVDPKYQRLINTSFIKKAKEFEPYLVKPLSVFKRPNGDYMIVDGQHTACLAATYVKSINDTEKDKGNFKLPCQVQVHPTNFTDDDCEKAEANYFKRFNSLRNTVSAVAKLRSDIAQGAQYALDLEETFQILGVQVEGIGAPITKDNGVYGYDRLKQAISKYGNTYVKLAIELYKKHNANSESRWNHPLNGGMILGLTATYHFLVTQVGNEGKKDGFLEYLDNNICKRLVDKFIEKTQGPIMDILILEKILEHYNLCVEQGSLAEDYPSIGMEKDNSIWTKWKKDKIHGDAQEPEQED